MRKTKFLFSAMLAIALCGLTACSSDDAFETSHQSESNSSEEQTRSGAEAGTISVTYKDITYKDIPTALDGKGNVKFLNENFSTWFAEMEATKPELCIYLVSDKEIILYDNVEQCLDEQHIIQCEEKGTRAFVNDETQHLGEVTLFDDTHYNDRHYTFYVIGASDTYYMNDLSDWEYTSFNDKSSSLEMTNKMNSSETVTINNYTYNCNQITLVFIGYANIGYGGSTIVSTADASTVTSHFCLPRFNDKMSSFKLFFGLKTMYPPTI